MTNGPSQTPPDAAALMERAQLLMSLGRYADAVPLFHGVLGLRPDNMQAVAQLGWVYTWSGKAAEGLKYMERALAMPAVTSDDFLKRIQTQAMLNRERDALVSAQEAIKSDPENGDILYALARCQLNCGKIGGARQSAERLRALYPDFVGSYKVFAQAAAHRFRWREAERWCDEALRCDPENTDVQVLRAKAIMRYRSRQYEGVDALWAATQQAPDNYAARSALDDAILGTIIAPDALMATTVFLAAGGLGCYLLLTANGFPRWLALIIAGTVFFVSMPVFCIPKKGFVPEARRGAFEKLPLVVRKYCALSPVTIGMTLWLGLFVLVSSILPFCCMIYWTIVGVPAWVTQTVPDETKGVLVIGMFALPWAVIALRSKWTCTFALGKDGKGQQSLSFFEAEAVDRVIETAPEPNKPPLNRVELMKRRLSEENW